MAGPLLEKNYRLAYYTRAGVGKYGKESDICPTQDYLDAHVEDLKYFLEDIKALSGIKRVILLGHSMGTLVAHLFAAKYPKDICGLISSGSVPMDIKNAQLWDQLSIETCKKGLWDWEKNSEGILDISDADSLRKRYNAQMMAEKRGSFLPYRKALNLRATQWEKRREASSFNSKDFFKADLQKITAPTLLLHGREDKVVGGVEVAQYLQKNISNSELKIFDGGHDLDKEYPYEYFSTIDAFIQKIENKKFNKIQKRKKNTNSSQ